MRDVTINMSENNDINTYAGLEPTEGSGTEYVICPKDNLTDIADALRTKTDTDGQLSFPNDFIDLIESTSLPSIITKMTGGTYVATSDIRQSFTILHGLGTTPSLAVLWSEATNTGYLGWMLFFGGGGGVGSYGKGTDQAYADLTANGVFKRGETVDGYYLKPSLTSAKGAAKTGDTFHWLAWV